MIADEEWTSPPLPESVEEIRERALREHHQFGTAVRDNFLIDFDNFTFVNHGAFGACMRHVQAEVSAWQAQCEAQPLRFIDRYA